MDEHTDDIMVALLPVESYWSTLEYPHLTIVYCGLVNEQPRYRYNELLKAANDIAQRTPKLHLRTSGVEVFGPEDKQVDVIRIELTPRLRLIRAILKPHDEGRFPEFKPHCTIGPVGSARNNIPTIISFDRIVVAWGADRMAYQLNG
jgi:2'-5' RNA ligase